MAKRKPKHTQTRRLRKKLKRRVFSPKSSYRLKKVPVGKFVLKSTLKLQYNDFRDKVGHRLADGIEASISQKVRTRLERTNLKSKLILEQERQKYQAGERYRLKKAEKKSSVWFQTPKYQILRGKRGWWRVRSGGKTLENVHGIKRLEKRRYHYARLERVEKIQKVTDLDTKAVKHIIKTTTNRELKYRRMVLKRGWIMKRGVKHNLTKRERKNYTVNKVRQYSLYGLSVLFSGGTGS